MEHALGIFQLLASYSRSDMKMAKAQGAIVNAAA